MTRNPLRTDFAKLWTALSISLVGSEITMLALPLIAARTLGSTAFEMGVLAGVEQSPPDQPLGSRSRGSRRGRSPHPVALGADRRSRRRRLVPLLGAPPAGDTEAGTAGRCSGSGRRDALRRARRTADASGPPTAAADCRYLRTQRLLRVRAARALHPVRNPESAPEPGADRCDLRRRWLRCDSGRDSRRPFGRAVWRWPIHRLRLGAVASGGLGSVVGVRAALFVFAVGMLVSPLIALPSPLRNLRDQPADVDDHPLADAERPTPPHGSEPIPGGAAPVAGR